VDPGLWLSEDGALMPDPERDAKDLPEAPPRLLPKEEWLVRFCQNEMARGRRVMVFVRLTGKRDIQERLENVLSTSGLRTSVLRRNVPPRRRDSWLRKQAPDVLITNPRLVETGLNLVGFATVVFAQPDLSLYVCWQSARRTWRPGQLRDVRVVYVAYEDSQEQNAVGLIGEKQAAAQLLYGEQVCGALVPEQSDDFLEELAKAALDGRQINLEAYFARVSRGADGGMDSQVVSSLRFQRAALPDPGAASLGGYSQGALL
jgi:hypothetical protein